MNESGREGRKALPTRNKGEREREKRKGERCRKRKEMEAEKSQSGMGRSFLGAFCLSLQMITSISMVCRESIYKRGM